jgi:indolepyruvate ferredoxin oxidoreductase
MGGEGAAWVGQAPFTETRHVFANLGDGTYFHSGLLAIRQAVAAGHPITYKILYNDAVAMTGGQPVDGSLSVPQMAHQLVAEGVKQIVVVTDGSERAYTAADLPQGVPLRHRDELDTIQRELREFPCVSALIYDQTCAAEKRRRRKRGKFPDPARRVFINEAVCEGCGDCSEQSNCLAVSPRGNRIGQETRHRPVRLQQGLHLPEGLLPQLRHRRGRPAEERQGGRGRRARLRRVAGAQYCPRQRSPGASSSPASAAPA